MPASYFHRVHGQSPTRFWINNPTAAEAAFAIEAGAFGCTTNPAYLSKMLKDPVECAKLDVDIDAALALNQSDEAAAASVQRAAVARLASAFLPVYEASGGNSGWVSIQISPYEEGSAEAIIADARENRKISPAIIAKIPVTAAGLEAISILTAEGVPVLATEVMGLAQAEAACAAYRGLAAGTGRAAGAGAASPPAYFVTHISGIFDDYMRQVVAERSIGIEPDILFQAGLSVARRQYALMKGMDCPAILLGGGARGLHHFTEMVGGDVHVTINWKGGAERLLAENPPVVWRMDAPVPGYVVDTLSRLIPEYRQAIGAEELAIGDFEKFGPVVLFRNSFIQGWDALESAIAERRKSRAR
jgi:transaldolase